MNKLRFSFLILILLSMIDSYAQIVLPNLFELSKEKPVMIMYTAQWCSPCRLMKQKVFQNENVIRILREYNNVLVDVDSEEAKQFVEFAKEVGYNGSIPFFMLLDKEGKIIATEYGFMSPDIFVKFLLKIDVVKEAVSNPSNPNKEEYIPTFTKIGHSVSQGTMNAKKLNLFDALLYYRWRIEIAPQVWFGWYSGSEILKDMRMGYGLYVGGRKLFKASSLAMGISIDSWGAKSSVDKSISKEYFVRVPFEWEIPMISLRGGFCSDFYFRTGVWGGFVFAKKTSFATRNLDVGVQGALIMQMGSFDLSLIYARGFIDRLSDKSIQAFNNALGISFGLNLGD